MRFYAFRVFIFAGGFATDKNLPSCIPMVEIMVILLFLHRWDGTENIKEGVALCVFWVRYALM